MYSSLPPNWRTVKIKDVGKVITGSTPPTTLREFYGQEFLFITAKDFKGSRFITNTEKMLSRKGAEYLKNRIILPPYSIMVTCIGSDMGKVALTKAEVSFTNQQINSIIPDKTKIEPLFLYYALRPFRQLIKSLGSGRGSAKPILPKSEFEEIEIPCPPLQEQRKIAEILGSLDDKIELNYEMNKTLEAIAQAIFKNWFVDFEPFKDQLVYNEELDKEIPKGWEVVNYSAIVNYTFGFPFDSSYFNEKGVGFPIIRIRDLPYNKAEIHTTEKFDDIYVVKSGEILVSMDGEFKAYIWKGEEVLLNQRIVRITPREAKVPRSYLYYSIMKPLSVIEASKVGTTVIHLNKEDLDEIRIILPKKDILEKFAKVSEPIIDLQVINVQENLILERIRDLLLPKLLSGEIRVKVDVEKEFLEEAKKLEEVREEKAKLQESLDRWFK